MRNVVFIIHVSLDGYVRAAGGDVMGWIFRTYDDKLKAWEVPGRALLSGFPGERFARPDPTSDRFVNTPGTALQRYVLDKRPSLS